MVYHVVGIDDYKNPEDAENFRPIGHRQPCICLEPKTYRDGSTEKLKHEFKPWPQGVSIIN